MMIGFGYSFEDWLSMCLYVVSFIDMDLEIFS